MYRKDSPDTIQSMFNTIAKRYDLTNSVLSFSLHKRWNQTLIRLVKQKQQASSGRVLVDLCSGTGDIALGYLQTANQSCDAYLVDFSSGMLEYAKRKANQRNLHVSHQLSYIEADVQKIPLSNEIADFATMAYGIRNVQNPGQSIREAFRILKPGGILGVLELTRPRYRVLQIGHQVYLRMILPIVGKLLTDNKQAYEYLCRSIQAFIPPEDLEKIFNESGFVRTECHSLAGGIATIILGQKG